MAQNYTYDDVRDLLVTSYHKQIVNPQMVDINDGPVAGYTDRDGAHCIVGQLLEDEGLACPRWEDVDNLDVDFKDLVKGRQLPFTRKATELLDRVQLEADCGSPWDVAIQKAHAGMPEMAEDGTVLEPAA